MPKKNATPTWHQGNWQRREEATHQRKRQPSSCCKAACVWTLLHFHLRASKKEKRKMPCIRRKTVRRKQKRSRSSSSCGDTLGAEHFRHAPHSAMMGSCLLVPFPSFFFLVLPSFSFLSLLFSSLFCFQKPIWGRARHESSHIGGMKRIYDQFAGFGRV